MRARRGGLPRQVLALGITVVIAALAAACSGGNHVPSRLLDGSPAPQLPIELEGLTAQPVLTNVRVVSAGSIEPGSTSSSCLQMSWGAVEYAEQVVERTAVSSETVTFRDRSRHGLYGCDNSAGPREGDRHWCGVAFGRLYSGRLRDPRLGVGGCRTRDEEPVGFLWVEPHRDARYVVVQQPGYAEVYRVAGSLPVRVATMSGLALEESRATFHLSEHDAQGRLVRRYQVDAAVAG